MKSSSKTAKISSSILAPQSIMWPIIRAFRRLGNQMLLFFGGLGQNTGDVDFVLSKCTTSACKQVQNLADAQSSLNYIGAATRELASHDKTNSSSQPVSQLEDQDYRTAYQRLVLISAQWEQDMQELLHHLGSPGDHHRARILEIQYLCGNIKASMIDEKEAESLWDDHYSKFIRICQLSLDVIVEEQRQISPFSGFFLDSGILLPLYFVAHRCRDPRLRRLAIGLLEQCQHQEGALSGPFLTRAASSIMNEEERGLETVAKANDIPEVRRLREVFFDFENDFQARTYYDPDRFRHGERISQYDANASIATCLPRAVRNAYCSLL